MSPEIVQLITIIFAPTGFVMLVAGGIIYSMNRKHDKDLIDAKSNADDKTQDNENFALLIGKNADVNLQLISAFGDLLKQNSDTEKTHREIAQAQTTALESNTRTVKDLKEVLGMSSENADTHFKDMATKLESITSSLETVHETIRDGYREQGEKLEKVIDDIHDLAEKLDTLETPSQATLAVDKSAVVQTVSNIDLTHVQTATPADNDDTKDNK